MQGREGMDRTFLDAASVVGHLVDPGSMFAFLATHRGELFPDQLFADLFPSVKGRSSIPAPVMASVMTLQTLHDYSDRETAEAVRCDLRWKVACGLALDDAGFDPSTLPTTQQTLIRGQPQNNPVQRSPREKSGRRSCVSPSLSRIGSHGPSVGDLPSRDD
jgi:hypothetical protein